MPKILVPEELQAGDILLKWIMPGGAMLSKLIGVKQHSIVSRFTGHDAQHYRTKYGVDPTQMSHVALAYGNNEILEYDEGSGIFEIMKFKGEGCVKMAAAAPERQGNKYLVMRCNNAELARRVSRKMTSVYSYWETSKTSSYGIRKLVASGVFNKRGSSINDDKIREVFAKIKGEQDSWLKTNRMNFFCSHFAVFVYLWAANDMAKTGSGSSDLNWVFGVDQARISPGELTARLLQSSHFSIVGEYAP